MMEFTNIGVVEILTGVVLLAVGFVISLKLGEDKTPDSSGN